MLPHVKRKGGHKTKTSDGHRSLGRVFLVDGGSHLVKISRESSGTVCISAFYRSGEPTI